MAKPVTLSLDGNGYPVQSVYRLGGCVSGRLIPFENFDVDRNIVAGDIVRILASCRARVRTGQGEVVIAANEPFLLHSPHRRDGRAPISISPEVEPEEIEADEDEPAKGKAKKYRSVGRVWVSALA